MAREAVFPDNKQRVLDASDIVDVVGDHVALKSKGREFVGLCPFHDDHSPSMYVVPHKQIFHCFVCGAGGNAIDFLMRLNGMGFREALEALADRAGIELERASRAPGDQAGAGDATSREDLARANALALQFYRAILAHPEHGRAARKAIEARGVSDEMVEQFQVGAAPDRWDGLQSFIASKGHAPRAFVEAGLLKTRTEGNGHYDALRNRLVFPILDQSGRAIAFGGRRLDEEDEPKYLNSPETALFDKSATLFGLRQATRAIRQTRTAIICEGYTDVIACHQGGFDHTLATLGTALTKRHAPILRRMCERVILVFDGDDAGQRAADRALEVFFSEPIDVRIAVLPEGTDPDDLLKREEGKEQFQAILDSARDYLEFRFARLHQSLAQRGLEVGSAARARQIEEEIERLVELGLNELSPIRRSTVIKRLTTLAGVDGEAITQALASVRPRRRAASTGDGGDGHQASSVRRFGAVELALGCLLVEPALGEIDPVATEDILGRAAYASGSCPELARAIMDERAAAGRAEVPNLLQRLESTAAREAATTLYAQISRETDDDPERVSRYFRDCLTRVGLELGSGSGMESNDGPPRGEVEPVLARDATTTEPSRDSLSESLSVLRERHEKLGGNPLALPRPRAGPT